MEPLLITIQGYSKACSPARERSVGDEGEVVIHSEVLLVVKYLDQRRILGKSRLLALFR